MSSYKPPRASKRWLDGDCPSGVLAIFDDKKSGDRYTVIYAEPQEFNGRQWLTYVGMSEAPFHPLGIGQHGEMQLHEAVTYRYANHRHSCKWSSLPEDCKRLVRQDLEEGTNK